MPTDIARQIVAAVGDAWIQPGALGTSNQGLVRVIDFDRCTGGWLAWHYDEYTPTAYLCDPLLPILEDSATLGIIESLLPDGWHIATELVWYHDPDGRRVSIEWRVDVFADSAPVDVDDLHSYSTKLEALAAALTAAKEIE